MSTAHDNQPLAIVSDLDGLPTIRVPVQPLPPDHPDLDAEGREFATDMAVMARAGRKLLAAARTGERKPPMPDDDLLCDLLPGCDAELHMAVDMAAFELLADDIAAWKTVA